MKHAPLWVFCLTLSACSTAHRPVVHVPPEEAAWFKLPYELPKEGQQTLSGTMATAIQLAMDDFLPRHVPPPGDATPREICLHQRQAYDVEASPSSEQVMWVRITVSPGACSLGRALYHDMGATYAVDTRHWRILAVRRP
jgi:hypothetical protein